VRAKDDGSGVPSLPYYMREMEPGRTTHGCPRPYNNQEHFSSPVKVMEESFSSERETRDKEAREAYSGSFGGGKEGEGSVFWCVCRDGGGGA